MPEITKDDVMSDSERANEIIEMVDKLLGQIESRRESGTVIPLRGLLHVRNSPILTRAA
jgi:hypothetical protein